MEGIEHRTIEVNGIKMHIAEKGKEGPVVLFLHGFPELWYSWRHQIAALGSLGYRAVAPDLRGYGDTEAPSSISSYTIFHLVGDVIALIDSLGVEQVFLVAHDWGATIGWHVCLFRPERIKAYVCLSVPYFPRNPKIKPLDAMRALFGDDYYVCRFQCRSFFYCGGGFNLRMTLLGLVFHRWMISYRLMSSLRILSTCFWIWKRIFCTAKLEPGKTEAEFAKSPELVMKAMLTSRSDKPLIIPKEGFLAFPEAIRTRSLPFWLSQQDIDYYASKFEKTGFTGALNYYRNFNLNWELTAAWTGAQVNVPVKFITGDSDLVYVSFGSKQYIERGDFKKDVPNLEEVVIQDGVAHFNNQEAAEEISNHIYEFIEKY